MDYCFAWRFDHTSIYQFYVTTLNAGVGCNTCQSKHAQDSKNYRRTASSPQLNGKLTCTLLEQWLLDGAMICGCCASATVSVSVYRVSCYPQRENVFVAVRLNIGVPLLTITDGTKSSLAPITLPVSHRATVVRGAKLFKASVCFWPLRLLLVLLHWDSYWYNADRRNACILVVAR